MRRPPGTYGYTALPGSHAATGRLGKCQTQAIAPTGNGCPSSGDGGQTAGNTILKAAALSRLWVSCQGAEVYQQRLLLLCDSTAEDADSTFLGATNQQPSQAGDAQQVPNAAQEAPAPPPSSSPSSCPPRRTNGCVPIVQKSSPPESPGQALSEFMMRETALPSSRTLTHTVRPVRAGPRNQQPTQPPRESVGSSWLLGTVCQREASSAAYLSRLCLCVR